jgi:hypothetical protein
MDQCSADRRNVVSLDDYRPLGSPENGRPPPSPRPAAARPCVLPPPVDAVGLIHPANRPLVIAA